MRYNVDVPLNVLPVRKKGKRFVGLISYCKVIVLGSQTLMYIACPVKWDVPV